MSLNKVNEKYSRRSRYKKYRNVLQMKWKICFPYPIWSALKKIQKSVQSFCQDPWQTMSQTLASVSSTGLSSLFQFYLSFLNSFSFFPHKTLIMSHFRYYTHFGVSYYQIQFITLSRMKLFCFHTHWREWRRKERKTRYIPIKTETLRRIPNIYLIHYLFIFLFKQINKE